MGLDPRYEVSPPTALSGRATREWARFSAVLLLALLVRFLLLDRRWINADEGAHLMDGRLVLDGLLPGIDFSSRQFIYVQLLALYVRLCGTNLILARAFPVLLTGGAATFLYLIARRLYNPAVALLALVLFSLLPFSILLTINVKTEPVVLFFALGGLFFAVRGVQQQAATLWPFFLSGLFLGVAYYVRQSALAVAVAVGMLLLAVRPSGIALVLKRLSALATGVLAVTALVVLYYLQHVSLAMAVDLSQNPIRFVLDNLHGVGRFVEAAGVQGKELWVTPVQEQVSSVTLQNFRDPAFFHLFLLIGAVLSLFPFWAARRNRDRAQQLAFWSLVPWLAVMSLAYAFWSIRRGFFPAYFLEFLPPLCILTAATVVAALGRLRTRPAPAMDALIVGLLLLAFFGVQRLIGVPELKRPVYFVTTILVLGAMYLRGDRPLRWALLISLAGVATVGVSYAASRLSTIEDLVLYAGFAGAMYFGVLFASGLIGRGGFAPRIAGFVSYSLIASTFVLSILGSAARLDLAYDCSWSPSTLRQIATLLKREARSGDEVMSGGVIWEFQSGLRPFGSESHPLVYEERMSVSEADTILSRLRTSPPAFVILDGFTQLTYLRNLPQIQRLLDSRYELRGMAADRGESPVRLFALRRGPV